MQKRTKIIIVSAIALVGIGTFLYFRRGTTEIVQTEQLQAKDLKRTVLATGTVTSSVDLDLAFKGSGIIRRIPVKVGQKVVEGDILAQLDARDQVASVTQARGAVAQAKANIDKVLAGASNEEVAVAQIAVTNAEQNLTDVKSQQAVLVNNARHALLNSSPAAIPDPNNVSSVTIAISGAYTGTTDVQYVIKFFGTGSGQYYAVEGPGGATGPVNLGVPLPLNGSGLYMTVTGTISSSYDRWTVTLPNTQAPTYVANLNAFNAAVQNQTLAVSTAQSQLDSARATLNLKKIQARPADIAAAQAALLSAEGQLEAANAQLENTIIRAPVNATITKLDTKVGEQATALKPVITLQDVGNLYIEANISEANIAQIQLGQKATCTFDALGTNREFEGVVATIDPASTVTSGVVNYKITISVPQSNEIKPGMTANVSVMVGGRAGVLAVPQRAVISKDGKQYVRVVTDIKKNTYREQEVETGLEADGGVVEITKGLSANQTIVTFIK